MLPQLRVFANINHIGLANKGVVEVLRQQPLDSKSIGWDVSLSALFRPNFIQNIVFRASSAVLFGGGALDSLFATQRKGDTFYSALFNLILTY